jgi:hypothetical protein
LCTNAKGKGSSLYFPKPEPHHFTFLEKEQYLLTVLELEPHHFMFPEPEAHHFTFPEPKPYHFTYFLGLTYTGAPLCQIQKFIIHFHAAQSPAIIL